MGDFNGRVIEGVAVRYHPADKLADKINTCNQLRVIGAQIATQEFVY